MMLRPQRTHFHPAAHARSAGCAYGPANSAGGRAAAVGRRRAAARMTAAARAVAVSTTTMVVLAVGLWFVWSY